MLLLILLCNYVNRPFVQMMLLWPIVQFFFSPAADMLWVLVEIIWNRYMWREHLSQTKSYMFFQVHSRLLSRGIIWETFRSELQLYFDLAISIETGLNKVQLIIYQECREACGGQGLKTENLVGHLKGEFDVQSTFEGDNNVLMQQVDQVYIFFFIFFLKEDYSTKNGHVGLWHIV